MKKSNYPQSALEQIEPSKVQEITTSLLELHNQGKPESNEELRQRIDAFFNFCRESSIRPGVESLCLSLHISRTTMFNWLRGDGCDQERQEIITSAKSVINAFVEQALLSGAIPVPSAIFVAKNVLGYKDTVSIEDSIPQTSIKKALSLSDLELLDLSSYKDDSDQVIAPPPSPELLNPELLHKDDD
mgnify:CR=1 FL=1